MHSVLSPTLDIPSGFVKHRRMVAPKTFESGGVPVVPPTQPKHFDCRTTLLQYRDTCPQKTPCLEFSTWPVLKGNVSHLALQQQESSVIWCAIMLNWTFDARIFSQSVCIHLFREIGANLSTSLYHIQNIQSHGGFLPLLDLKQRCAAMLDFSQLQA